MNGFFVEEPFHFRFRFSSVLNVPNKSLTSFDNNVFHGITDDERLDEASLASNLEFKEKRVMQYILSLIAINIQTVRLFDTVS